MSLLGASNLEYSVKVFDHVVSNNDAAYVIETKLAENESETIPVPRHVLANIAILLRGNSKMVTEIFEENQYILDRVSEAMKKHHDKH